MMPIINAFKSAPELVYALCRPDKNERKTPFVRILRDILTFGSTCKDFYAWINQKSLCQTLNKILWLDHAFSESLDLNSESWNGFLARRFSVLNSWHSFPRSQRLVSRGASYGKAFVTEAGILFFDLGAHPVKFFLLGDETNIIYTLNLYGIYQLPKIQTCLEGEIA